MVTGKAIARVGDQVEGVCYAHESPVNYIGTWVQGSDVVTADGKGVIRVGDTGTTDCGHHIRAIEGSGFCTADGISIHRVGDAVEVIEGGVGVTVTGSSSCTSL